MNHYEAKQEARRERLEAAAAKARVEAESRYNQASALASVIPFGQPILVGHHSEGRDRRYRSRIDSQFDKAFAAGGKADELEQRAAAVGTGGISSDDPDAPEKLAEKLAGLERLQATMVAANKLIRKGDSEATREKLAELGLTEKVVDALFAPVHGRPGFASYQLTNNNANIKRVRARLAELARLAEQVARAQEAGTSTVTGDGWEMTEDLEDNRILFRFEDRQPPEVAAMLKSHAFKWSPTRGGWCRQITANARYAAKTLCKKLSRQTTA
jgi:hypothetical protein